MQKTVAENIYAFAEFELAADRRILLKHGEAVALKSKAFDLLLTLVQNRGEVLSKEELLETVWEGQFVEENNLTVHISALRKIFGEKKGEHRFIATVPGKGYCFVADLNAPASGEIIVENRSFSRIIIEEDLPANEHRTAQLSAGKISGSKIVLLSALAFGGLLVSLAGYWFYQKYAARQNFAVAWNDSALAAVEPRQITASGKIDFAALSPDGNYFAFVTAEAEKQALWFNQIDGNQKLPLRPPERIKYHGLTFAPGGSQIYYAASGGQDPNGALFRIPTMGGAAQKVLEKIKSPVTFSPDGKQFAFVRFDNQRKLSLVLVADTETGANEREIASRPVEKSFSLHGAAWSPDGKLIAVGATRGTAEAGDEVLLVSVGDGKIETLGADEWNSVRRAAWLKDGSGLLVNAIDKENWEDRDVWLLEYPGGQRRKITRDIHRYGAASVSVSDDNSKILAVGEQSVSNIFVGAELDLKTLKQITGNSIGKRDGIRGLGWTADGRIVFSQFFDKFQTLWIMDADGGSARQITPPGFLDRQIAVSKDGQSIFFDSMRNGVWKIRHVSVDGGDARQITVGGVRPALTPDGKWIFYTGNHADGYASIWKISAEGGSSSEPVRVLEQSSDWASIAPDGTRFACLYRPAGGKTKIAVFPIEGGAPLLQFDLAVARDFGDIRWSSDGQSLLYRSTGLWRQALSGGAAEKVLESPGQSVFGFDQSPDGQQFAVTFGNRIRDVVLFSRK